MQAAKAYPMASVFALGGSGPRRRDAAGGAASRRVGRRVEPAFAVRAAADGLGPKATDTIIKMRATRRWASPWRGRSTCSGKPSRIPRAVREVVADVWRAPAPRAQVVDISGSERLFRLRDSPLTECCRCSFCEVPTHGKGGNASLTCLHDTRRRFSPVHDCGAARGQQDELARVKAFVAKDGVEYTYLSAGAPAEMWEKVPQAVNLNTWPATIFVGLRTTTREAHPRRVCRAGERRVL